MKICHLTSVHPRYDIRIFIKECQALAQDYDVSLIVADSLGGEKKDGIVIYDVGKSSGGRLTRMRLTSQAIFAKVQQLAPQVVHFHDPELLGIGAKLAKLGYQVIYDVHEDVPKQVMNKHWIPRILRPLVSALVRAQERRLTARLAGVICATEIIAERFLGYNSRTCAIHNYPILAELNHAEWQWQTRQDRLCYIGSISLTRGILPLVDSLATSQLSLDLAGNFSTPELAEQLQQSPGYAWVNYLGNLNREQIAQLLATVKCGLVTLLPTPSYLESLPIKLFEYMLAGIPVVASNFPLWEQIVTTNRCGLMVDPQDSHAIAHACRWLIEHPDEAAQMGENGRQAVLKHYTWEREQQKLRDFYAALLVKPSDIVESNHKEHR